MVAVPFALVFDIFKLIFSPLAPSTKATSAQVYPFTRHLISFAGRWDSTGGVPGVLVGAMKAVGEGFWGSGAGKLA